ncbi:MAG: hypothetical protein EBX40_03630, partial [Gammaproteobacteria bacterium]|nr:hypothetical protein [Gammaproteobacteria bacterium]
KNSTWIFVKDTQLPEALTAKFTQGPYAIYSLVEIHRALNALKVREIEAAKTPKTPDAPPKKPNLSVDTGVEVLPSSSKSLSARRAYAEDSKAWGASFGGGKPKHRQISSAKASHKPNKAANHAGPKSTSAVMVRAKAEPAPVVRVPVAAGQPLEMHALVNRHFSAMKVLPRGKGVIKSENPLGVTLNESVVSAGVSSSSQDSDSSGSKSSPRSETATPFASMSGASALPEPTYALTMFGAISADEPVQGYWVYLGRTSAAIQKHVETDNASELMRLYAMRYSIAKALVDEVEFGRGERRAGLTLTRAFFVHASEALDYASLEELKQFKDRYCQSSLPLTGEVGLCALLAHQYCDQVKKYQGYKNQFDALKDVNARDYFRSFNRAEVIEFIQSRIRHIKAIQAIRFTEDDAERTLKDDALKIICVEIGEVLSSVSREIRRDLQKVFTKELVEKLINLRNSVYHERSIHLTHHINPETNEAFLGASSDDAGIPVESICDQLIRYSASLSAEEEESPALV